MYTKNSEITKSSTASEIVVRDHRTSDIFRKYGIEYCCGGRWPLETVCMMKGVDFETLRTELDNAIRSTVALPILPYDTWRLDFLTSYIVNVHHYYLKTALPGIDVDLKEFSEEHRVKYPNMVLAYDLFTEFNQKMMLHMVNQEDVIFPYICRISHAYHNKDAYAQLLVKTLRKPLEATMQREMELVSGFVSRMRELTNEYVHPEKACVSHKVVFAKLKELDADISQHIYLENEILLRSAIQIERELLSL